MLDRPSNLPFSWTQEAVETLTKLWSDGLSASQVAAQMGGGLTRSAVIGKVTRLKLPKRAAVSVLRKPNGKGQPKADAIRHRLVTAPKFETAPLPEEELGNDVTHLVGLMELTNHTCRWPHGDPHVSGFGFCGKQTAAGSRYCEVHHKLATRQP